MDMILLILKTCTRNFRHHLTRLHNQFWILWLYSNSIFSSWIKNYFNKFRLLFLLPHFSIVVNKNPEEKIDELFFVEQFSELHLVIELIKYWKEWDDKRKKGILNVSWMAHTIIVRIDTQTWCWNVFIQ